MASKVRAWLRFETVDRPTADVVEWVEECIYSHQTKSQVRECQHMVLHHANRVLCWQNTDWGSVPIEMFLPGAALAAGLKVLTSLLSQLQSASQVSVSDAPSAHL